jgi:hypothetical protein
MASLQGCEFIADEMCDSVEPVAVLTLARVHGLQWSDELCKIAAAQNKLMLLQWLRSSGCCWEDRWVTRFAMRTGSSPLLEWLHTVTESHWWSGEHGQTLLHLAACFENVSAVKWLREHAVEWPDSYVQHLRRRHVCWLLEAVQFALRRGAGWLNWSCQSFSPSDKFSNNYMKENAVELFEWAHGDGASQYGSPCTCSDAESSSEGNEQV